MVDHPAVKKWKDRLGLGLRWVSAVGLPVDTTACAFVYSFVRCVCQADLYIGEHVESRGGVRSVGVLQLRGLVLRGHRRVLREPDSGPN